MPERPAISVLWRSALARRTALLNFMGLTVLVVGALALNDIRKGLVEAKIETLEAQALLMTSVLADAATVGSPEPRLEDTRARAILQRLPVPPSARIRLFDATGVLLADSDVISDHITTLPLPAADAMPHSAADPNLVTRTHADNVLRADIAAALSGEIVAAERQNSAGRRVASVALPVQRVKAVLGVLVIEAGDIDAVIAAERRSLLPFIFVAVMVTLASSIWLAAAVVGPLARLARAADAVRLGYRREITLPDVARRSDEIGELTRAMGGMTQTLIDQADANARFAADVAHEIKNPLASIRSAAETLGLAKDETARQRLLQIMASDVARMDRLITETLHASRLDAEVARAPLQVLDLATVLDSVMTGYAISHPRQMVFSRSDASPFLIRALDDPMGRVVRNLVDNALSFSPAGGQVRVQLARHGKAPRGRVILTVDDDGPGLPADALHRVFDRYYTQRPVSDARSGHSGLGLAIVRQIVHAFGGQITAENRSSADGGIAGARFIVDLPAYSAGRA